MLNEAGGVVRRIFIDCLYTELMNLCFIVLLGDVETNVLFNVFNLDFRLSQYELLVAGQRF